ncbi:MAG: aminoglycoside phosphotransferase family protein [Chloroflexi bacterium]|nr:aminoglycoside phosphotransferase family protein [Chloroflexota bacterium]
MSQDTQLLWEQPEWLAQAHAWIHGELERQGVRVSGAIEQPHVRPWSTVLRVPTTAGVVYFKATAPYLAREAALMQALSRWRPDCIPRVLAADVERGWMLMEDCGTRLRSVLEVDRDLRHWHRVLPIYAELQIELASRRDELLALGALDRRLAVLPERYAELLADRGAMGIGWSGGLTPEEYARLHSLAPQVAEMCAQLADYRIPETLDHNDLHDNNILVRDGRYVLFDWGDACVAHPFFSMLVVPRAAAHRLGLAQNDPELARLDEIYLEPWARYGSREDLRAAMTVARRLAMISRVLNWRSVLSNAPESFKQEFAGQVPEWLQEFLDGATGSSW